MSTYKPTDAVYVSADFLVSGGADGVFEPQRKNHFAFEVELGDEVDIKLLTLAVDTCGFPKEASEEIEFQYLNKKLYVAGELSVEDIPIVLKDFCDRDVAGAVRRWRKSVYNYKNGTPNLAGRYKREAKLKLYAPDGSTERVWLIHGAWPKDVSYGDGDYSSSENNKIEVTIKYDWAEPAFEDDEKPLASTPSFPLPIERGSLQVVVPADQFAALQKEAEERMTNEIFLANQALAASDTIDNVLPELRDSISEQDPIKTQQALADMLDGVRPLVDNYDAAAEGEAAAAELEAAFSGVPLGTPISPEQAVAFDDIDAMISGAKLGTGTNSVSSMQRPQNIVDSVKSLIQSGKSITATVINGVSAVKEVMRDYKATVQSFKDMGNLVDTLSGLDYGSLESWDYAARQLQYFDANHDLGLLNRVSVTFRTNATSKKDQVEAEQVEAREGKGISESQRKFHEQQSSQLARDQAAYLV